MENFTKEELARYNRHIIIPEFGCRPKKIKSCQSTGCRFGWVRKPILLYLAAAGVGTIGIVDYDVVEDSNLHRQVYLELKILACQAETAKKRLLQLNPYIEIMPII